MKTKFLLMMLLFSVVELSAQTYTSPWGFPLLERRDSVLGYNYASGALITDTALVTGKPGRFYMSLLGSRMNAFLSYYFDRTTNVFSNVSRADLTNVTGTKLNLLGNGGRARITLEGTTTVPNVLMESIDGSNSGTSVISFRALNSTGIKNLAQLGVSSDGYTFATARRDSTDNVNTLYTYHPDSGNFYINRFLVMKLDANGMTLPAMTLGSIPYIGIDGLVTQNNSGMFWDAGYGILHIGENSWDGTNTAGMVVKGTIRSTSASTDGSTLELHASASGADITSGRTDAGGTYKDIRIINSNTVQAKFTTGGDLLVNGAADTVRGVVMLSGYMRGDTLRISNSHITVNSHLIPTWMTNKAVNGTPYIDSIWANGCRITSTWTGEPDSAFVNVTLEVR